MFSLAYKQEHTHTFTLTSTLTCKDELTNTRTHTRTHLFKDGLLREEGVVCEREEGQDHSMAELVTRHPEDEILV